MLLKKSKQKVKLFAVFTAFSLLAGSFFNVGGHGVIEAPKPAGLKAIVVNRVVVTTLPQSASQIMLSKGLESAKGTVLSCQGVASANFIVQNQATVNLNQPANCFSLNNVALLDSKNLSLSVSPGGLFKQEVSVVNIPGAKISAYHFRAPPAVSDFPVAPLLSLTLASVLALSTIRRLKQESLKLWQSIKTALTLEQLQVLRC